MYVVNTRVAENGRRLVKLREFYGRVLAHGVAPEPPEMSVQSMERMMKDKDAFVAARGGTVKTDPQDSNDPNAGIDSLAIGGEDAEASDSPDEN